MLIEKTLFIIFDLEIYLNKNTYIFLPKILNVFQQLVCTKLILHFLHFTIMFLLTKRISVWNYWIFPNKMHVFNLGHFMLYVLIKVKTYDTLTQIWPKCESAVITMQHLFSEMLFPDLQI